MEKINSINELKNYFFRSEDRELEEVINWSDDIEELVRDDNLFFDGTDAFIFVAKEDQWIKYHLLDWLVESSDDQPLLSDTDADALNELGVNYRIWE